MDMIDQCATDKLSFQPPPEPPPLLSSAQLLHLLRYGWLSLGNPDDVTGPSASDGDDNGNGFGKTGSRTLGPLQDSCSTLFAQLPSFFDQPVEQKRKLYSPFRGVDTEFGYYLVQGEKEYLTIRARDQLSSASALPPITSSPSSCPTAPSALDRTASLNEATASAASPPTSSSPQGPLDFQNEVPVLWNATSTILHRILCDISRVSNLPCWIWDDLLDDGALTMAENREHMSNTLLRLFRYFPSRDAPDGDNNDDCSGETKETAKVVCSAEQHTDLGILTLCIGQGQGLQVLAPPSSPPSPTSSSSTSSTERIWIDVPPGPIILTGGTLSYLSNGLLRPGLHRVVGNPDGRQSIIFALRPSLKHRIDLSIFDGGARRLADGPNDTFQDMKEFWMGIKSGKINVNARVDIREEQRRRQRARNEQMDADGDVGKNGGSR